MSQLTRAEVERIAKLAALKLSDDELRELGADLAATLDYVEQLAEVSTEGVEPTSHLIPFQTPLRRDEPEPSLDPEELLMNAPARAGSAFAVPKVIESEE